MTEKITFDETVAIALSTLEAEATKYKEKYEKLRNLVSSGRCTTDDIDEFEYVYLRYTQACDKVDSFRRKGIEDLKANYELFDKMARDLKREFNALVYDDIIEFKYQGSTLSWITKALASMYKLHAGMFSFESSFTRHEAFTESNHLVHIGIKRDTSDTVVICFNFKK